MTFVGVLHLLEEMLLCTHEPHCSKVVLVSMQQDCCQQLAMTLGQGMVAFS
jgi:hypothetical protein